MSNLVYIGPACDKPDVFEAPAAATITPRQVLVLTAGELAVAGAAASTLVYFADCPILGELATNYAAGETVQAFRPKSGEYYELILAASQTIAKNGPLKTNASGHLVAQAGTGTIVAYADEAVTTTGAVGSIRVYVA